MKELGCARVDGQFDHMFCTRLTNYIVYKNVSGVTAVAKFSVTQLNISYSSQFANNCKIELYSVSPNILLP